MGSSLRVRRALKHVRALDLTRHTGFPPLPSPFPLRRYRRPSIALFILVDCFRIHCLRHAFALNFVALTTKCLEIVLEIFEALVHYEVGKPER